MDELKVLNDVDSTQYRYRMPMDHFGESDWYGLQPGHTWLEGEIFYPESALKNTQPNETHRGTRGGMGVMINDNPDAPEYSFLYKDGSGQFFIDDYKGENLTDRLTIIIPPNEHITGHDKISDSLYYSQIGGRTYKTENGFTEAEVAASSLTFHDVVIVASLVEKETSGAAESGRIGGIRAHMDMTTKE